MNTAEIDLSLEQARALIQHKIQKVFYLKEALILQFYLGDAKNEVLEGLLLDKKTIFLVFCSQANFDAVFVCADLVKNLKSETKPLYLFAKSHLSGAVFKNITRNSAKGRLVQAKFEAMDEKGEAYEVHLDHILAPIARNLSLQAKDKHLHLNRPKELPDFQTSKPLPPVSLKDLNELKEKVVKKLFFKADSAKISKKESRQQALSKKTKLFKKLKQDLEQKEATNYQEFAQALGKDRRKAQKDYPNYFDEDLETHQLQEKYFQAHKKNKEKVQRLKERLQALENEIQSFESMSDNEWQKKHQASQKTKALSLDSSKGKRINARKLDLAQDLIAYIGKSAKDNAALLRQAKAWHYWLHIKDQPSAYVIVHCLKSRQLSLNEVSAIAKWFVESSTSLSQNFKSGDKLSLLVTQCRYVRPVKGDKLGRVNYTREQVFTIRL